MKEIKKFQNLLKTFKFEDSTVCDLNDNTIRLSIGTKDFKKEDNISDILLRLKYTIETVDFTSFYNKNVYVLRKSN